MSDEDYFTWREMMERCQRENDRQMQSLLYQMKRLKQENEELQAQMSASGPSQSRHPQSQQTTSRRIDEAYFLRNTEFSSSSYTRRSKEGFSPAC